MKILVAYATRHRSTAEVAQFIGTELSSGGFDVIVADCDDVTSIEQFDAVIIGTPVYTGTWLPNMQLFVQRNQADLNKRPLYCFMTCIHVLEDGGDYHARRFYVPAHLAKTIRLRDIGVFPGKLSLNDVDWQERWTISVRYAGTNSPTHMNGDFRDWNAIRLWAQRVMRHLPSADHES